MHVNTKTSKTFIFIQLKTQISDPGLPIHVNKKSPKYVRIYIYPVLPFPLSICSTAIN